MRNILNYQTSEYDCGPTTLVNAMRYLFEREQINPELLKAIYLYTLDAYNEQGETGKKGTSPMAMKFLSSWFNQYGLTNNFPISSEFLEGDKVYISQNSPIVACLQQKGVAVVRVWLGEDEHYILLVTDEHGMIGAFDPYYEESIPDNLAYVAVTGQPHKINRMIKYDRMNMIEKATYALGSIEKREAMLIYNTKARKTQDNTVEYVI